MPNWIEGTFRARGKKENIKKFLMEGLEPTGSFGVDEKIKREIVDDTGDYFLINYTLDEQEDDTQTRHPNALYIPKTRRNFVKMDSWGDISAYKKQNSDDFVFATNFKGAGAIDTDAIEEIATEYKIDIRVNGFECGMEFEQLFEVTKTGHVKCESYIQYDNYIWECPMPLLGG